MAQTGRARHTGAYAPRTRRAYQSGPTCTCWLLMLGDILLVWHRIWTEHLRIPLCMRAWCPWRGGSPTLQRLWCPWREGHTYPWRAARSGCVAWRVHGWEEHPRLRRPAGRACASHDHWRSGDAVAARGVLRQWLRASVGPGVGPRRRCEESETWTTTCRLAVRCHGWFVTSGHCLRVWLINKSAGLALLRLFSSNINVSYWLTDSEIQSTIIYDVVWTMHVITRTICGSSVFYFRKNPSCSC